MTELHLAKCSINVKPICSICCLKSKVPSLKFYHDKPLTEKQKRIHFESQSKSLRILIAIKCVLPQLLGEWFYIIASHGPGLKTAHILNARFSLKCQLQQMAYRTTNKVLLTKYQRTLILFWCVFRLVIYQAKVKSD